MSLLCSSLCTPKRSVTLLTVETQAINLLRLNRVKYGLKQKKIELHYTKEAVELLGKLDFDLKLWSKPSHQEGSTVTYTNASLSNSSVATLLHCWS
ncbi:hypothetical protein RchiOBHm_Chr1g0330831 [Rosa chinensis]|uniref:Uncharacterized protein n=1 Tax=Rosa chinensis TaxID=74649 RepID=A0A2P6SBF1_ROSCH|nr:hypothetical protein RchiOBHm_Chr1g0330831 [Rosa chinensis]